MQIGFKIAGVNYTYDEALALAEAGVAPVPTELMRALINTRQDTIPSASSVGGCLRRFSLERREDFYNTLESGLPSLFGTAMHSTLSSYAPEGVVTERRLFGEVVLVLPDDGDADVLRQGEAGEQPSELQNLPEQSDEAHGADAESVAGGEQSAEIGAGAGDGAATTGDGSREATAGGVTEGGRGGVLQLRPQSGSAWPDVPESVTTGGAVPPLTLRISGSPDYEDEAWDNGAGRIRDWKSKIYLPRDFYASRQHIRQLNIYNWLRWRNGLRPLRDWELVYFDQRSEPKLLRGRLASPVSVGRWLSRILTQWYAAEQAGTVVAPIVEFHQLDKQRQPVSPCKYCEVRGTCVRLWNEEQANVQRMSEVSDADVGRDTAISAEA